MRIGTLFSVIVWFFLVVQGHARDVQVGKTWLHINPPQGYCELEPTQPADAALLQFSHTENLLLSHSVDCIELADYRSGKREFIDHFAKKVVLAAFVDAPPEANPLIFLDTLCQKARATGGSVDAKTEAEIKAKIEKNIPLAKYIGSDFQGLIANDSDACYTMAVAKLTAQNGVKRTIMLLTAFVMIKGKLVYHFLYSTYVDTETPIKMLAEHRKIVAAMVAANR